MEDLYAEANAALGPIHRDRAVQVQLTPNELELVRDAVRRRRADVLVAGFGPEQVQRWTDLLTVLG